MECTQWYLLYQTFSLCLKHTISPNLLVVLLLMILWSLLASCFTCFRLWLTLRTHSQNDRFLNMIHDYFKLWPRPCYPGRNPVPRTCLTWILESTASWFIDPATFSSSKFDLKSVSNIHKFFNLAANGTIELYFLIGDLVSLSQTVSLLIEAPTCQILTGSGLWAAASPMCGPHLSQRVCWEFHWFQILES